MKIEVGSDGTTAVADVPGLGLEPDLDIVERYLVDVEIAVAGKFVWRTPTL